MKTYHLPLGRAKDHTPENPERTATKRAGGIFCDVTYQVWPSREAMALTIRMQQRGTPYAPWRACVPLAETEGYSR